MTESLRSWAVKVSSGSLPALVSPRHRTGVNIDSDRREIVRNAWSARRCAQDRPIMIGLAVIRGIALAALGFLALIAVL